MDFNETNKEETVTSVTKTPVKPQRGNPNDTTYVDLYLSVSESPYRISRIGGCSESTFFCNDTLQTEQDVTFNVQNNDCTIFIPQVNFYDAQKQVNEIAIDPLSMTYTENDPLETSCCDDKVKESSTEKNEEGIDISSVSISEQTLNPDLSAVKYGDSTIMIPGICSDIRDCPAEFDPLSLSGIESSTKSPVKDDTSIQMSYCCVESTPVTKELENASLDPINKFSLELDSSDIILRSMIDNETSDIGSLLMLSTEPNDSVSSSNDVSSSKSTVKDFNCNHNSLSQLNALTPRSKCSESKLISKQLIFNSLNDETATSRTICDNDLHEKSIILNLSTVNESLLSASLHNTTNQDINASISFSDYDKWLPTMKTQLKELMKYIKVLSSKNEVLENKVAALSRDNEDLKNSKKELNLINEQIESEKMLLGKELEILKVGHDNLQKEMDSMVNSYKSMKNYCESLELAFAGVKNENAELKNKKVEHDILRSEYDSIKKDHALCDLKLDEMQSELTELQSKLIENETLKNEHDLLINSVESFRMKHESALCEIDQLKSQLQQMQQYMDENEQKSKNVSDELKENYSSLEFDYQKLKCNLEQSELKLKSLQEDSDALISQLKLDKDYLSDKLSTLKIQVDQLLNEKNILTDDKRNQEGYVNELLSKLELIENENLTLNKERTESMQMLYELLNIQYNCTFKELINKFQKQFYDFTLLEEKIKQERLNHNVIKSENTALKEENHLLLDDIKRLEEELKQKIDELYEEKNNLSVLKRQCGEIQNDFQSKLMNIDNIKKDSIALHEKFEHFKMELSASLGISSDSPKDIISKVSNLVSELNMSNQQIIDIQDKIILFGDCHAFWQANKKIFFEIIQTTCEVEGILEEMFKGTSSSDSIDPALENMLQKCSHYKAKLGCIAQTISPEYNHVLREDVQDLCRVITATLSMTESNLNYAKRMTESNYRLSLSGGSLQDEDSKLKDSIEKIVNSSEAYLIESEKKKESGVLGCADCDPKLREMNLLLLKRSDECESQLLEIKNLKSRYYSKSQALDNTRKEMYKVKMELATREKKYLEIKENLKMLKQVEKVLTDVSTQCEAQLTHVSTQCEAEPPPKAPLPPPSNFIQVCKMDELYRKLQKMNKMNLCLKEDSRKKDAKIACLKEELKNCSKPSSGLFNRSILEDKTNTET